MVRSLLKVDEEDKSRGENPSAFDCEAAGQLVRDAFGKDQEGAKPFEEAVELTFDEAMETAKLLASKEGILAGISAGAAMYAAAEVSKRPENKGKTIVVILPDTGERYLSTELYA